MNSMYPKKSNGNKSPRTSVRDRRRAEPARTHPGAALGHPRQGRVRPASRSPRARGSSSTPATSSPGRRRSARHPHDPDDPNHTFFFHIDDKRVIDGGTGGLGEVDQPRLRSELRGRRGRGRRPRLHQGAARHRARRGAQLRLRPGARGPADGEGEGSSSPAAAAAASAAAPCSHRRGSEHGRAGGGRDRAGRRDRLDQHRPAGLGPRGARRRRRRAARPRRRAADRRPRPPRAHLAGDAGRLAHLLARLAVRARLDLSGLSLAVGVGPGRGARSAPAAPGCGSASSGRTTSGWSAPAEPGASSPAC